MSLIVLAADDDRRDWRAETATRVEPDGTITLTRMREWCGDFEPDDLSEQTHSPEAYRQ